MASWSPPLSPALSPASDFLLPADNIIHSSFTSSPLHLTGPVFSDDLAASAFDSQETLLGAKDFPNIDPGSTCSIHQNYAGSMTESVNSRARKMSQSSNEREMSTDVKLPPKDETGDPEPDSRGIKRKFSTDVVDYPRRRATIAVRR